MKTVVSPQNVTNDLPEYTASLSKKTVIFTVTATSYGIGGRGVGVRVPSGAIFSLLHSVQTDFEANTSSYTMGTGRSFPGGVKRPGRDSDHSSPPSDLVPCQEWWSYISNSTYVLTN
jgi:hypothetical protein